VRGLVRHGFSNLTYTASPTLNPSTGVYMLLMRRRPCVSASGTPDCIIGRGTTTDSEPRMRHALDGQSSRAPGQPLGLDVCSPGSRQFEPCNNRAMALQGHQQENDGVETRISRCCQFLFGRNAALLRFDRLKLDTKPSRGKDVVYRELGPQRNLEMDRPAGWAGTRITPAETSDDRMRGVGRVSAEPTVCHSCELNESKLMLPVQW
jgi:hypothetical protein